MDEPGIEFRPPAGEAEWAAYHAVRRDSLFRRYLPDVTYDPDHPDESAPGHFPHALFVDGELVATVRIDLLDSERAALRVFAVRDDMAGRGLGSRLVRAAEAFVRAKGRKRVLVRSHPGAVGFYRRHGYGPADWDEPGLGEAEPMAKDLA